MTPQELNEHFQRIHAGILAYYDGVVTLLAEFDNLRAQSDEVWDEAADLDTVCDRLVDLECDWQDAELREPV